MNDFTIEMNYYYFIIEYIHWKKIVSGLELKQELLTKYKDH